jgi:nucleoid DNA-binding protein
VALPKLGKFTIKFKDEYEGKNPRTAKLWWFHLCVK